MTSISGNLMISTERTGREKTKTPDETTNQRAQEFLSEAALQRPDWDVVPALSAEFHDRIGNVESAITKYLQAVALGWRQPTSIRRLIQLLTKEGRFGEADSVIRQLRSGNQPFSPEMSRLASEISFQMADLQRAVRLAKEAVQTSATADDYLWLGQLNEMVGDAVAAESAYKDAIAAAPDSSRPTLAWVGFLDRNSRLGEAREALAKFESTLSTDGGSSRLELAEGYQRIGSSEEALRVLNSVSSDELRDLQSSQRYYEVLKAADGDGAARVQLQTWLDDASSEADDSMQSWVRRQLALDLAQTSKPEYYGQSVALIQQNLDALTDQNSTDAFDDRKALAIVNAIYLAGSQPEVPAEQFRALMAAGWQPSISDQFTIGQLAALQGDLTAGRRLMLPLLTSAESRQPIHIKMYIQLLLENDDAAEAELWIDRLQELGMRDEDTATLTAEVLLRRRQYERLLRLLTVDPGEVAVGDSQLQWFATTLGYSRRFELLTTLTTRLVSEKSGRDDSDVDVSDEAVVGRFKAAIDQMASKIKESGEFPGMFYATQMLLQGDCAAAAAALKTAVDQASQEELVAFADRALATTACTDFYREMESIYRSVSEADATDVVYQVIVARIREARGDYEAAVKSYESILQIDAQHFAAKNNLATLLALRKTDPTRALKLIQQLIADQGETLVTLDTRGVCHLALGDLPAAAKDFEAAMKQYPHPVVQFHQAQAALMSDQNAMAEELFAAARRNGLQPGDVHPLEAPIFRQLSER